MINFVTKFSALSPFSVLLISCSGNYNISQFGAKGDGSYINTIPINKAIEKCAITGGGDFDRKYIRQGESFMKKGEIFDDGPVSYPFRPGMMITFERCERVSINGVTLKDSPEGTVRLGDCDDV